MICTCTHQDCYYVFYVKGQEAPEKCPDCGKCTVRPAVPEEIAWFYREQREEEKAG